MVRRRKKKMQMMSAKYTKMMIAEDQKWRMVEEAKELDWWVAAEAYDVRWKRAQEVKDLQWRIAMNLEWRKEKKKMVKMMHRRKRNGKLRVFNPSLCGNIKQFVKYF